MSFGTRLREKREELGMKQSELGKLLGVTGSAIGNYENGVSSPKADILYRVFDVLHCDANYLFQDEIREQREYSASPYEMEHTGWHDLTPYSCRHSTATALALDDIAPSVIQKVMRHAKFTTTQQYIHVDVAPMLDAVNKMADKRRVETTHQTTQ